MKKIAIAVLMGTWALTWPGPLTRAHVDARRPACVVGEKLHYTIYWGPFAVGRASLEVVGVEKVDDHDCFHLLARAKTSGLAESLYPVDSKTESWWDTDELVSRKYTQDRSEGGRKRQDETVYDYTRMVAVTTNRLTGKVRRLKLEECVQDVLTAVYYMRSKPLSLDTKESLVVNANKTNYPVSFQPDTRKEISVKPLGKVTALRIEPNPTLKIVESNGGKLWVWISDDENRYPLQVVATMKIGSARLVLTDITKPDDEVSAPDQGASQSSDAQPGTTVSRSNFTSSRPAGSPATNDPRGSD
jgi:hypothetical protein